jgi:hypothetical protein
MNAQDSDDADETNDDAHLLAGDIEDDDSAVPTDGDEEAAKETEASNQTTHIFTPQEVLQRRRLLVRTLDRFNELLKDLLAHRSRITTRIAGQTMFFLWLMRYGCRFEHGGVTGGTTRLMVPYPSAGGEREYSFVIRTMWILLDLWRGDKAIASQIQPDARHGELQDDLYGFAVHSRWALARAYLICLEYGDSSLAQRIAAAALDIIPVMHRLGPIDTAAEKETLTRLDADFGCSSLQTDALLQCCGEFERAAALTSTAPLQRHRLAGQLA